VNKKSDFKIKYIGKSHRSAYERGCEHVEGLLNIDERNHFLKHLVDVHPTLKPNELELGMRVRKQFKNPLERQVGEAIAIREDKLNGYDLMNSKSEFHAAKIKRIAVKDSN